MSGMTEEHTGGMIALIPRAEDIANMVVAGGTPAEEMHLTLTYLGDDVTSWDAGRLAAAAGAAGSAAAQIAAVTARVMGHGVFNPDGHEDRQPCAVYLVGDSAVLSPLRAALVPFAEHEQHEPFHAHVTAGFGVPIGKLSFTGPVVFDHLRVALGPQVLDFPLGDPEEIKRLMSTMDTETKGKLPPQFAKNAAAKKAGAGKDDKGGTADKGINNIGDLAAAVKRYKSAKDDAKAEMWPKISAAAKKLNATKMIAGLAPKGGGKDNGSEKKLFEALELEFKVTSEDPRAVKMRRWWALSTKGRGYWKPGVPGDFKRLVRAIKEHTDMPARMIKGFAANVHHLALGQWPGREGRKEAFDWLDLIETKGLATGEIDGTTDELFAQYKAARAALDEALSDDEEDDPDADVETMGDAVDAGVRGDDGESPEEVYEDAIDTGIDWNLEGDGTLEDPDGDELDSPSEPGENSEAAEEDEDPDDEALAELDDIFSVGRASS